MQSPSSMLSFPHSPSEITSTGKKAGVATNLLYKLSGYVAYTSVAFSTITEAINTLTAGGATEPEPSTRKDYKDGFRGDVIQINADDSDGAYDNNEVSDVEVEYNNEEINKKKVDRKNDIKWTVDDDEPPPPYDSSWAMPKNAETNSRENNSNGSKNVSVAPSRVENKSASASSSTTISQTIPRRRQIRVRRPRRLLRRKSSSPEASTPKKELTTYDDPEKMLLKVNNTLSDMIAQARAALTSTVDVTEVEMILAEEKEREEKIMKELGLQAPVGRKGRKNTASLDDYFTSISDGYSSPEFDFGFNTYNGHGSGFDSPSGYETPDSYPSHDHYNTSSQFHPGAFGYHNLGYGMGGNNNNSKFGESDFLNQMPNRFYGSTASSGFDIPKGFGNGPVSGGFGGPARFGSGFRTNYGPSFGSPNGGFVSNGGYDMYRGFM